jgi:hypothetical protein
MPTAPKLGRPKIMAGGKRVNVYLDAQSLAAALKLGGGNVSAGIRIALVPRESLPVMPPRRPLRLRKPTL